MATSESSLTEAGQIVLQDLLNLAVDYDRVCRQKRTRLRLLFAFTTVEEDEFEGGPLLRRGAGIDLDRAAADYRRAAVTLCALIAEPALEYVRRVQDVIPVDEYDRSPICAFDPHEAWQVLAPIFAHSHAESRLVAPAAANPTDE